MPAKTSANRKPNPESVSKKTRLNIAADFETDNDPNNCHVWHWGITDINNDSDFEGGLDIDSFIERIQLYNSNTYFHNLKHDGRFILDWLLKNGYTHVASGKHETLKRGQFKSLISDMGMFYSLTVCWFNGKTTEFRDSLKKIPMSLARAAEAFNLPITKGEIDYDMPRPIGYQPTNEEWDYLERDVKILAQVLRQVLNSGMTRLTVASDSLAEYKRLIGGKQFSRLFPVFNADMDAEIRRAYRGGFTYADPRFSGRVVGSGLVLDVNSLYPSVMRAQPLPYDFPQWCEGEVLPDERRPLTIFSVTFTAKLKPNHIPCIQIKGSSMFSATEYLDRISEPTTLMVTNVDWALYNDHYDITVIEYGGGWRFHATSGMFDTYIDKWAEVKANSKGGMREIAKLHLNSLYGKFASNPNVTSKYPVLDDEGVVRLKTGADETREPVYTAVGVFITSYARDLTIRAAQANYDTFAYADTDSLHLLQDNVPDTINVHPHEMGAWKLEYHFDAAYYVRAKFYLERQTNGIYHNAVAGLPTKISGALTFDDLVQGRVLHGKLLPRAVPGGVILENSPFELKL